MGIGKKINKKFRDVIGSRSGTSGNREIAGISDPKPYESYYSNGMFRGYNGELWLFFRMPEDVKVEWTKTYDEAAENQEFLTNVINELGSNLFPKNIRTKNDERIKFQIPLIREDTDQISKYDGITPAMSDFLDRMGGFLRPTWHAYLGLEMKAGDINSDVHGVSNKIRNYVDFMMGRTDINYQLFKESITTATQICLDNGLTPLDFQAHPEDFHRLTAWFAESDERYGMPADLTTTPLFLPEHGKSLFTGTDEIAFYAIKPSASRDMFMRDPFEPSDVSFSKALFRPSVGAVHINIRGEIRNSITAANLFDNKYTKNDYDLDNAANSESKSKIDQKKMTEEGHKAFVSSNQASIEEFSWLDNVEMTVAVRVRGSNNELAKRLARYNMDAVNIIDRQHLALFSTIPTYPEPIFRVYKGDRSRNPNVNNFFSGVLSMSGLFRSTKACGPRGVILGMSDGGFEFKEVFTETDAAHKYSMPPVIMVTGATGSGKATSLNTRLMTPTGPILMRDVELGTELISPDGGKTKVTYMTEVQEDHDVYDISLFDGQHNRLDYNHQMIVRDHFPANDDGRGIIELIDEAYWGLEEIINSGGFPETSNLLDIYDFAKSVGGPRVYWNNPEAVAASLHFVNHEENPRMYPGDDAVEITYNTEHALRYLQERLLQRRDTFSWRLGGEDHLTRLTVGEMLAVKPRVKSSSRRGRGAYPRFSIPTTQPVTIEKPSFKMGVDPLAAGFILAAGRTADGQGLETKADWAVGDLPGLLHATRERVSEAMGDDIEHSTGVFGKIVISKDEIDRVLRENVLDEDGNVRADLQLMSLGDRFRFVQGLIDGQCHFSTMENRYQIKMTEDSLESLAGVIRSLGVMCVVSKTKSAVSFFHPDILAGDKSPVEDPETVAVINSFIPVLGISRLPSEPVRCIQVDNHYHSFLIDGYVPTSNTVEMLMIVAQFVYLGQQVVYLNPKPRDSLKPFFDALGGTTINMSNAYLEENPGLLDPMFFLEDRVQVARLLTDMIIKSRRMTSEDSISATDSMEELGTEIMERAKMPQNECSYDIIFGNQRGTANTPRISDDDVVSFVRNKMERSPLWKATISKDPGGRSKFQEVLAAGKPLLVEWDDSVVLPDEDSNPDRWTPDEIDGVQSVVNLFEYSSDIIGNGKRGGILAIDESQVLRNSRVAMDKVKKSGSMWRSANINLMLATQNLKTFLERGSDSNISQYVRLYIMMEVAESEMDIFYDITGLPKNDANFRYMTNAGIKTGTSTQKKMVPNAYVIDRTYEWEGGIIAGPWPTRELNATKTAEEIAARKREEETGDDKLTSPMEYAGYLQDKSDEDLLGEIADENRSAEEI